VNTTLKGKFRHPTSLVQANTNVILALESFNEKRALEDCYRNHEKTSELILKGEHDVIWGIILNMKERSPETNKHNIPLHLLNTGLPYSLEEVIKIENTVITWLKDLNLIDSTITKILEIEERIRSGKLLYELATIMHNYNIRTIITEPKNSVTALSNIRKAFELFRKLPKVNKRYLWSEKQIFNGDRAAILGLLNDLHNSLQSTKENNPIMMNCTEQTFSKQTLDLCLSEVPEPYPYPLKPISYNNHSLASKDTLLHNGDSFMRETERKENVKEMKVVNWIKGLGVKISKEDSFDEVIMKGIKNGVLLVQIVEILDRCNMKGICNNPKSSASSLHNIQQALKVLNKKKSISVEYLFAENEILNGNKDFILKFLDSIRLAYPHILVKS